MENRTGRVNTHLQPAPLRRRLNYMLGIFTGK
jgi:hypothetical protein